MKIYNDSNYNNNNFVYNKIMCIPSSLLGAKLIGTLFPSSVVPADEILEVAPDANIWSRWWKTLSCDGQVTICLQYGTYKYVNIVKVIIVVIY